MSGIPIAPQTEDEYGFTIESEVSPLEWCNRDDRHLHEECIHIVPDIETGQLHLYRAVGDIDNIRRVKTTLENVRVRYSDVEAECWCLHAAEANTFISFLNLMVKERSNPRLTLTYYADNGKQLTEDTPLTEEALYLKYQTDSDRQRQSVVQSVYRHPSQMMKRDL